MPPHWKKDADNAEIIKADDYKLDNQEANEIISK